MTEKFINSDPYLWPYDGDFSPRNTALLIIDMQTDFCGRGGYVDTMGYDLSLTRDPIEPIKAVLSKCRELGFHVFQGTQGPRMKFSKLQMI